MAGSLFNKGSSFRLITLLRRRFKTVRLIEKRLPLLNDLYKTSRHLLFQS